MSDNYLEYPIWTRSIELDASTLKYKTNIHQFLAFFEYYINNIIDSPDKEARVNFISTTDGLELQVVTLDFNQDQVENYYDQFITFLAEPNLLKKVINKVKQYNEDDTDVLKDEIVEELLNKLIVVRKEVLKIENSLLRSLKAENQTETLNTIKKDLSEVKNRILDSLTEKKNLEKNNQYFQEILSSFSPLSINIINNQTKNMTTQNFSNSTINNSGNIVFGNNYSDLIINTKEKISNMVSPDDKNEDKLIQIQGYLLELIELVTTNQDIPEHQKEVGIKAVDQITNYAKHDGELDDKNKGIIQNSLQTISSIFNAVGSTVSNLETLKNLAGIFGLKI